MAEGDRSERVQAARKKHRAASNKRNVGAALSTLVVLGFIGLRVWSRWNRNEARQRDTRILESADARLQAAPTTGDIAEGIVFGDLQWTLKQYPGPDDVHVTFNGAVTNNRDHTVRVVVGITALDQKGKELCATGGAITALRPGETKGWATSEVPMTVKQSLAVRACRVVVKATKK